MKTDVKDLSFCRQRNHIVPRADMTKMLSDDGKSWRMVCQTCKDDALEFRKNAKRKQATTAPL